MWNNSNDLPSEVWSDCGVYERERERVKRWSWWWFVVRGSPNWLDINGIMMIDEYTCRRVACIIHIRHNPSINPFIHRHTNSPIPNIGRINQFMNPLNQFRIYNDNNLCVCILHSVFIRIESQMGHHLTHQMLDDNMLLLFGRSFTYTIFVCTIVY